jgi:hypothetical protein
MLVVCGRGARFVGPCGHPARLSGATGFVTCSGPDLTDGTAVRRTYTVRWRSPSPRNQARHPDQTRGAAHRIADPNWNATESRGSLTPELGQRPSVRRSSSMTSGPTRFDRVGIAELPRELTDQIHERIRMSAVTMVKPGENDSEAMCCSGTLVELSGVGGVITTRHVWDKVKKGFWVAVSCWQQATI